MNKHIEKTLERLEVIKADIFSCWQGRVGLEEDIQALHYAISAIKENEGLKESLYEIGNIIGSPTMKYAPTIERKELLSRIDKVSKVVADGTQGMRRGE